MTPLIPDRLAISRELCERSLAEFVRQAWGVLDPGMPYVHGWHIDAICEHLEAVTNGQINRLLINVPPGTSKSSLVAIYWPAWEWARRPEMRFIGASHEQGLAVRDSLKMRRLIESEWYQSRWPCALMGDNNQKLNFENDRTGFRQACAVRSMTGRRGDRILWDDPHSAEDANSAPALAEAERIFRETLPTRLVSPEHSAIIIVMQRLSTEDVSGVIAAGDYGYEHLCLPMEYEPARACRTSIGFLDPRTTEGELLFSARFPSHVVERDKKIMGSHATAGQFQQRPTPKGGNIIKSEWFARYGQPPRILWRSIYADTAQKTAQRNDYTVFACWGRGDDGRAYLLDILRGKWEAPELKRRALDFWRKHRDVDDRRLGALRALKVEDKASGTGLIQEIRREGAIPVIAVQRERDKYSRLMDVLSYIEAGLIVLPDSAQWVSDFITECEGITADDSHAHDDQVDTMIDAIDDMLAGTAFDLSALL
jgi:predicted phage terminase large subunit-like protein